MSSSRSGAGALITELERDAAKADGRIYLAKDALAASETIKAMYPDHGDWLKAIRKADPTGAYETDMTRRLNLRDPE